MKRVSGFQYPVCASYMYSICFVTYGYDIVDEGFADIGKLLALLLYYEERGVSQVG
ncbi:hypothetical protein [Anaplasma phagocytophilum]|uniref:hypothetical protein n=1 Tax=Anaplasma phagocytophilum TaxID=948 RepID=UPI000AD615CC|nr:hypothetical protein [Anaplasma phagocytophilum]